MILIIMVFLDKRAGTGGTLIHVTARQTARVLN